MKKMIGLMAVLFIFAVPMAVVQAVELDDITMQTMDANEDHASDVTNEIELPEQADDHNSANSESNDDSNTASNGQQHDSEMEQEQGHEQEMEQEIEHADEHQDEVQEAAHDESEVEQHDSETESSN